jgi:MFS family permease
VEEARRASGLTTTDLVQSSARARLGTSYWRVWLATTLSNLGDGLTLVAMPLLAASFTRDPITIAGIGVFTPLAKIVVSLAGGVLVDRADRRRLMLGADLLRFAVMLGFTALVVADDVSFVAVYAVVFVLATGEFVFDASSIAVVRDVVSPARLTSANGWLYAAEDGAQDLAAPPLAAILFTVAAWVPFLADTLTFAISAVLLLFLRGRFRAERTESTGITRDLHDGFRFIRHRLFFRTALVVWTTLGIALGLTLATLVLFALRTLGGDELGFALLITAGAVGIVLGNLATSRLEQAIRPAGVLVGAVLVGGVALLGTGLAGVIAVAAAAQVVWGVGFGLANTEMVSVRQRLVPDELLGRVTGIFGLASSVGMVLGSIAGGVLTDLGDPRVPLLVAGVVQVGAGLAWWLLLRISGGVDATPEVNSDVARG